MGVGDRVGAAVGAGVGAGERGLVGTSVAVGGNLVDVATVIAVAAVGVACSVGAETGAEQAETSASIKRNITFMAQHYRRGLGGGPN